MSKINKKFFFFFSFLLYCYGLQAQQLYTIKGRVADALTNEAVPFANVFFKGTTSGATTDIDGYYSFSVSELKDSLYASYVGYKVAGIKIRKLSAQTVNFVLRQNKVELGEVVIKAGENPALRIIRLVQEHRDENDKDNYKAFQYESYNKLEFDLTNISNKMQKRKLFKPFAFVFDNIDSTSTNEKPFLPIFISEALSNYYYRSNPTQKKEVIKATKISGTENRSITQYLGDMYQSSNVYDNFFFLFAKSFVSPISNIGQLYYKYYLEDSLFVGKYRCYKISFKPRRPGDLAFNGEMFINDSTWAIKRISMNVAPKANINFVNDIVLYKDFEKVENKYWMLNKEVTVVNFQPPGDDVVGFIGRKTTSYRDIVMNQPKPNDFFNSNMPVEVLADAPDKDKEYWKENRHEELASRERKIYAMVDTIKTMPIYKTYVDVITTVLSGYKNFGNIEIGPYFSIYSFNPIEGNRFRIGARTFSLVKNMGLTGYVAYGTKDEKWKYGFDVSYNFKKTYPRLTVGGKQSDDVQQLGDIGDVLSENNIVSSTFRRNPNNRLTHYQNSEVYFNTEWVPGFSNKVSVAHSILSPLGILDYEYYTNEAHTQSAEAVNTAEIRLFNRYQKGERFIEGKKNRLSLGSDYPELILNVSFGIKGVFNSSFNYQSVEGGIRDKIFTAPFGYLAYQFNAGKIFGTLPFPLLEVHKGNESYGLNAQAFNLMNYYEFVSDQYVNMFLTHHFDGFFLDKLPLLRRLKWREVASLKAVYGSLSDANKNLLVNPHFIRTLEKKPYAEAGVGIENIFKVFRVDALWRLTYRDNPNPLAKTVNMGIRVGAVITF